MRRHRKKKIWMSISPVNRTLHNKCRPTVQYQYSSMGGGVKLIVIFIRTRIWHRRGASWSFKNDRHYVFGWKWLYHYMSAFFLLWYTWDEGHLYLKPRLFMYTTKLITFSCVPKISRFFLNMFGKRRELCFRYKWHNHHKSGIFFVNLPDKLFEGKELSLNPKFFVYLYALHFLVESQQ